MGLVNTGISVLEKQAVARDPGIRDPGIAKPIDNSSNGREKNRKTFLEEPGWNWIEITLLVGTLIYEFENFDVCGRSKRGEVRWE